MKEAVKNCIEKLKNINYDGLIVSNPTNITYLTGFREADGYLLLTLDSKLIYFTNFLYATEAKKNKLWDVVITKGIDIFKNIIIKAKKLKLKKIGFEAKHLPYLEYKQFKNGFEKSSIDFLETVDLIENIRSIKTNEEISAIKKSIDITTESFEFVSEIYRTFMTEKDLSIELEKFLKLKSNGIAFNPIVASLSNSFYPHYIPNDKFLNNNFLIDAGAKYNQYCADLTRIFLKNKIKGILKKIFDVVRKAQELSITKIRDGIKAKEVDYAGRNFIDKKGFGKFFGHGIGHGVGLTVHEPPYINLNSEEVLRENMVITVEPAIYLDNKFGIRLEDMVLVKSNKASVLSNKAHIYFL